MKKNRSQLLNTLLIIVGAALLIFAIASKNEYPYFKIGGIVLLMFGLYRATNFFVSSEEERKNADKEEE